jgi:hypothetical protein
MHYQERDQPIEPFRLIAIIFSNVLNRIAVDPNLANSPSISYLLQLNLVDTDPSPAAMHV